MTGINKGRAGLVPPLSDTGKSFRGIFLFVVGLVLFAEILPVVLLRKFSMSLPAVVAWDAALLVVVLLPTLYFLVYGPLKNESLKSRAAAAGLASSHQMLLTVLDSLDAIVYVADMKTYELIFLNKFARDIFGDGAGKTCWEVLQTDQNGPCGFCSNGKLVSEDGSVLGMYAWEFRNTVNGHWYDIRDRAIPWIDGRVVRLEVATDITDRKEAEQERERLITSLEDALAEVKTLKGILPICSHCKKIRDDQGYWDQVEVYLAKHSSIDFSHGICPDCMKKHYPGYG